VLQDLVRKIDANRDVEEVFSDVKEVASLGNLRFGQKVFGQNQFLILVKVLVGTLEEKIVAIVNRIYDEKVFANPPTNN
jgi:hypothetical protein